MELQLALSWSTKRSLRSLLAGKRAVHGPHRASGLLSSSGVAGVSDLSPSEYALERRTYRISFQLKASGTAFALATVQPGANPDSNLNSTVTFDAGAAHIQIGSETAVALGFTPVLNRLYGLSVEINKRELTVTVYDLTAGNGAQRQQRDSHRLLLELGAASGCMFVRLQFVLSAGQVLISDYGVTGDGKRSRAVLVGDSISQGYYLALCRRLAAEDCSRCRELHRFRPEWM